MGVADELVALFHRLGFSVLIRDPDTAAVIAASPSAEEELLAAEPGSARIAAARVGGHAVRVELVDSPGSSAIDLTPRQSAVANLLGDGLHNREIAERLMISIHTVRRHVESILRRLHVRNRTAAAAVLRTQHGRR